MKEKEMPIVAAGLKCSGKQEEAASPQLAALAPQVEMLDASLKVAASVEALGVILRCNVRKGGKIQFCLTGRWMPQGAKWREGEWYDWSERIQGAVRAEMVRAGMSGVTAQAFDAVLNDPACTPDHDVAHDYFEHLPEWDGRDYIAADVAGRIALEDETPEKRDLLNICVRNWMLKMVDAWWRRDTANEYILTLVGAGGTYKTTFFQHLLPPEFRELFRGSFDVGNMSKDEQLAMGDYFILCMDDVDQVHNIAKLKNLTSESYINQRRPYAKAEASYEKIASFCATSNVDRLLTDQTGNRRWLTFRVREIRSPHPRYGQPFNHAGIYSQIKAMLASGYDYTFDGEATRRVERMNAEFLRVDPDTERILTHFSKPAEGEPFEELYSTQIAERMGLGKVTAAKASNISRALKKLGFESRMKNHTSLWKVTPPLPL